MGNAARRAVAWRSCPRYSYRVLTGVGQLNSKHMRFFCTILTLFLTTAFAQEAKEGTQGDAQKLVTIRRILVEGSQVPPLSVLRLAKISVGDQVNFVILHAAMERVTHTGLISNIDFEYESVPDKETDVILHMRCTDVARTAKASIEIAKVNEDDVWTWLTQVDPMFTREMPPTEAAIRFYSRTIGKYMEMHGDPKFGESFTVVAGASSSTGGRVTDRLVFKVAKLRRAK